MKDRRPGLVLFLCVVAMALSGPSPSGAQALPRIEVRIERIDTGRYPDLDIYFRVLDTNPTTEFHRLVRADVKVAEGALGAPLASGPPSSDNFARPELRPLAAAVVLDRSGSVDDVIRFIRAAIAGFVDRMVPAPRNTYRPTDPNVGLPDTTYTLAFAGDNTISNAATLPYTPDPNTIRQWIAANLVRGAGFSPVWGALERGVAATAAQAYDLPDGSRCAFLISDGQNNRGYPDEPGNLRLDRALRGAQGARIRVYALAMAFVNERGVVTGDINRPDMQRFAADTDGVYFEPRSPFPVVPRAPVPPDGNLDAKAPDALAREYVRQGLGTAASLAQKQAKTGALSTQLDQVVKEAMAAPTGSTTGTAPPATYEAFIPIWNPPPNPGPALNVGEITYRDLGTLESAMVDLAANAVTAGDLQQKDYYEDQVRNILTKIQTSEKTIYRVSYRVTDERFDGSLRQVALTVQYDSTVNGVVTPLAPGTGTATYRAPALLTEDGVEEAPFPIDMSIPQAALIFGNTDPRGNPWPAAPALRMRTRLITEVPSTDGTPAKRVVVASLTGDRFRPVDPPPDLPDLDRVNRHIAAERADYEALLRSLGAAARVEGDRVIVSLAPKTPTAVPNLDDATRRPVPNLAEPDLPRLLAYEVLAELERPYRFNTGALVVDAVARFALPGMSFYVADRTPPTLGVYLTPVSRGTNMVAVRANADAVDVAPPIAKVAVSGDDLGVPVPAVRTLVNGFDGSPYPLDGGGSIIGFVVPENVEVRVQVVAKDNFDRNREHSYLLSAATPKPLPVTDTYAMATRSESAAVDQAPPYLPRVAFDEVGRRKADNKVSGCSYRFEEAGQSDAMPDRKIFRAANVELTGPSTFRILPGQEIFLTVKASDATGNPAEVRIPVLVTPVGVNIDKLLAERERK